MMYREFIFPMMSKADWYALAGMTAVEYAAELTRMFTCLYFLLFYIHLS